MSSQITRDQAWQKNFSLLFESDDDFINQLIEKSKLISIPMHQKVISSGDWCADYLLVAEGRLRIQFLTRSGREVTLYHVNSGDDCVLTTSCLFGGDKFPAEGITETEVSVLSIPAMVFNQTLQNSTLFRQFVFSAFGKRLSDVIARMEEHCSFSIEYQLAKTLILFGKKDQLIRITHQELAAEIGSVREVVSRHLKKFESNQLIRLGRGNIELIDINGLELSLKN